jgi:murein DD-endopeptidase MepM/ murein hydrolase activator NlpD
VKDFLKDLIGYIIQRVLLLVISLYSFVVAFAYKLKGYLVQNLFWGRNTLYKNIFQLGITVFTLVLGFSGVTNTFALSGSKTNSDYLTRNAEIFDSNQGKDIQFDFNYQSTPRGEKYIVQSGDTLELIAKKVIQIEKEEYADTSEVTADRVKRKSDVIRFTNNLFSDNPKLKVGQELRVFLGIDGIIHTVMKGDTIKSIAKKYSADEQEIIDSNQENIDSNFIDGDSNKIILEIGSTVFVPNIDLTAQIAENKRIVDAANRPTVAKRINITPKVIGGGAFGFPLGSDCSGWRYERGFKATHKGIDLSRGGGCSIVAADSGTVVQAGWTNGGGGWQVEINHGNGFLSRYSHMRQGSLTVSPGMVISKGTKVGIMGASGRVTGTHLHFMIDYNGVPINPGPYIGF